jgi:hypothetical protein
MAPRREQLTSNERKTVSKYSSDDSLVFDNLRGRMTAGTNAYIRGSIMDLLSDIN